MDASPDHLLKRRLQSNMFQYVNRLARTENSHQKPQQLKCLVVIFGPNLVYTLTKITNNLPTSEEKQSDKCKKPEFQKQEMQFNRYYCHHYHQRYLTVLIYYNVLSFCVMIPILCDLFSSMAQKWWALRIQGQSCLHCLLV